MSYSVNQKCLQCKKEADCADGMIIRKAVETIHNLPNSRYDGPNRISGHLGGGTITHDCTYGFEPKDAEEVACGQGPTSTQG